MTRITVIREGGEIAYEATVRQPNPEEAPEVDECWRISADGFSVKLRPANLPDDVYDEIVLLAQDPNRAEAEPEAPEHDEDRLREAE